MDHSSWNKLAHRFPDLVLEIAENDPNGILTEEIKRAARSAVTAADIGCGAGSALPLLVPHFKSITAVDFAPSLLKTARKRVPADNITFLKKNLTRPKALGRKQFDLTLCLNTLIHPDHKQRTAITQNVLAATKPGGTALIAVPSFESTLNTYQALAHAWTAESPKATRKKALKAADKLFAKEVASPVDAIVEIGKTKTKTYLRDELSRFLQSTGFLIHRIRPLPYPWTTELENPPPDLNDTPPWDWLAIVHHPQP
ncbi:MAG: methyltransferase domain-containing protein [Verrucomicrobiota bacterium]